MVLVGAASLLSAAMWLGIPAAEAACNLGTAGSSAAKTFTAAACAVVAASIVFFAFARVVVAVALRLVASAMVA